MELCLISIIFLHNHKDAQQQIQEQRHKIIRTEENCNNISCKTLNSHFRIVCQMKRLSDTLMKSQYSVAQFGAFHRF